MGPILRLVAYLFVRRERQAVGGGPILEGRELLIVDCLRQIMGSFRMSSGQVRRAAMASSHMLGLGTDESLIRIEEIEDGRGLRLCHGVKLRVGI